MGLLLLLFLILSVVLWIWAFVDIIRDSDKDEGLAVLWILLILLFPVVGTLAYFWMKNRRRKKETRH
ncbi:MAG: PLD nuclease N-terminal domain-containing protein [Luteibaculum sp.]